MSRYFMLPILFLITYSFAIGKPTKKITDADILAGQDIRWSADTIYVIEGLVFVDSTATLTIDPGTVIQAYQEAGSEVATSLIICRGAKIFANGTAAKPIIFTTDIDDPNNYNEDVDKEYWEKDQLWGGVIILGNATINNNEGKIESNIEGINPILEPRGAYGGLDDNDNSGVFRYVSIRHGGFLLSDANEINGLTLGGVGRGTKVEFVEVYQNSDDGFEWFGGTVNCRYLVSAFNADDAFDYDDGYRGRGQFWFSIQAGGGPQDADEAGEHDGGKNTNGILSNPIISNCTYIGNGTNGAFDFKENAEGRYFKTILSNFRRGFIFEKGSNDNSAHKNLTVNNRLFIKQSLFWNIGDVNSKNIWHSTGGGGEVLVQSEVERDLMISWGDTIKDPKFSSWDPSSHIFPDFLQIVGGDFNKRDTTGEIGFDFRPTDGSPAILLLPDDATEATKLATWYQDEIEDSTGFIVPTAYIGAFSPWERPWFEGWTAIWNFGMAKRTIADVTTSQTAPTLLDYPEPSTSVAHAIISKMRPKYKISQLKSSMVITMGQTEDVSISLYTLTGSKIKNLYSGKLLSGKHLFNLDNARISSGNYLCSIQSQNGLFTQLILINK